MKNVFKQISFFALLLFIMIFSFGGCGGGNNSFVDIPSDNDTNNVASDDVQPEMYDDPEVLRILDKLLEEDEYGVPMVFTYAPLIESYDYTQSVKGTPINFVEYISTEDLNKDGEYVQTFALEKDNDYIIKYSRAGRTLDGTYLKIRITAPENQTMILDLTGLGKSSWDVYLENKGSIPKKIYVDTECEVIPEEDPCMILYAFKAPLTGNYEFAIKEVNAFDTVSDEVDETQDYEYPFEFRLYSASEAYSAIDDEDIELTPRQILEIQRILLEYATEFDEEGLPISFEEDDEYDESGIKISASNSSGYRYNAYAFIHTVKVQQVKVVGSGFAPRIDNVPYTNSYKPGAGFYAHSGLRSIQLTALDDEAFSDSIIEDFTIPRPKGDYTIESKTDYNYISTEEELLRAKGVYSLNDFTLLKDAIDNRDQKYAALGLAGTQTIKIRYERKESKPRMPAMEDFKVRSAVVHNLRRNFNVFQREHGDYFVAGYTFGMFYEFSITVTAKPYDCWIEAPQLGTHLRESYNAENISSGLLNHIRDGFILSPDQSPQIMATIEDAVAKKSGNVSISISNFNYSGMQGEQSFTSLQDLAKHFLEFKKRAEQTPSSKFERLYVTLIRYRELDSIRKYIPEERPIAGRHYNLIKDLNKAVYVAQCYKNAIDLIPVSDLINGDSMRKEWQTEFDYVFNLYKNQLNKLCSDIKFVEDYLKKFNELTDKYKGLNQRYVFYRHMKSYQDSVSNVAGNWSESSEYWMYPHFRIGFDEHEISLNNYIREDLKDWTKNGGYGIYGEIGAWSTGDDDFYNRSGTFDKNHRVFYYQGGPIKSNYSSGTDLRGHSFGKRSFRWKFDRPSLRRLEFHVEFRVIDMPPDKYPFTGLAD